MSGIQFTVFIVFVASVFCLAFFLDRDSRERISKNAGDKKNDHESHKLIVLKSWHWVLIAIIPTILVISLWYWNHTYSSGLGNQERGTFGDQFGAVNAFFSGLAFAGVVIALILQSVDMRNQRTEFAAQSNALQGQLDVMKEMRASEERPYWIIKRTTDRHNISEEAKCEYIFNQVNDKIFYQGIVSVSFPYRGSVFEKSDSLHWNSLEDRPSSCIKLPDMGGVRVNVTFVYFTSFGQMEVQRFIGEGDKFTPDGIGVDVGQEVIIERES